MKTIEFSFSRLVGGICHNHAPLQTSVQARNSRKMKNLFLFIIIARFGFLQAHLFIADRTMSRMIEFTSTSPYCYFFTDRDFIQHTLLNAEQRKVKITSAEEIDKLEKVCKEKKLRSSYQGGFIYPGTKWCGPGAIASNYTDLGTYWREDICCREHDHCPQNIQHGECKQGICNKSSYTRSHCDCDAQFRRCLQNVNSETANTIGAIFFNVVQVICFKQRSPCSDLQRTGYTQEEADRVCSQWKYRPSAKYYPLMSLQTR